MPESSRFSGDFTRKRSFEYRKNYQKRLISLQIIGLYCSFSFMEPSLTLPGNRPLRAELEYIYDDVVASGGLRNTFAHPPLTVWILREGSLELTFPHSFPPLHAKKGETVFLPSIPRTHRIAPGTHLLSCRFWLSSSFGELLWHQAVPFRQRDDHLTLTELSEELTTFTAQCFGTEVSHHRHPCTVDHPPEPEIYFRWSAVFSEWVQEFFRNTREAGWQSRIQNSGAPTANQALALLDGGGWKSGLRGEDLATHAGISLSQFKRRIQHETHLPFKTWLEKERLQRVNRSFEDSSLQLKEIAYQFGFSSPSHFSAWFRHQTGHSPREYRKSTSHLGV
jgi:AraC-like DNA-binding protein